MTTGIPGNILEVHPSLGEWAILSAYRGSIAHGMYVPSSDPNSIDDAEQLLSIKRGEWTLEQVKTEAERGFQAAEEAYRTSTLPPGPDMDRINELAVEVVRLAIESPEQRSSRTRHEATVARVADVDYD